MERPTRMEGGSGGRGRHGKRKVQGNRRSTRKNASRDVHTTGWDSPRFLRVVDEGPGAVLDRKRGKKTRDGKSPHPPPTHTQTDRQTDREGKRTGRTGVALIKAPETREQNGQRGTTARREKGQQNKIENIYLAASINLFRWQQREK